MMNKRGSQFPVFAAAIGNNKRGIIPFLAPYAHLAAVPYPAAGGFSQAELRVKAPP